MNDELLDAFKEAASMLKDAHTTMGAAREDLRAGHDLETQAKIKLHDTIVDITKEHGLVFGQPDGAIVIGNYAIISINIDSGDGVYTERRAIPIVKVYPEE